MTKQASKTDLPPDQQKLAEQATEMDGELAALRARFDQYFLGIERKNPSLELDDYRKRLVKLKSEFIRNTGLKFRVQSLYQKFQSYERLWLKSLREVEQGTYSRDLFKLRRKNKEVPEQPKAASVPAQAAPRPEPIQKSPPAAPPTLPPDKVKRVYDAYVQARRSCKQSVEGITLQAFENGLRKQIQKGIQPVDLKVVIKEGKATVKFVVK